MRQMLYIVAKHAIKINRPKDTNDKFSPRTQTTYKYNLVGPFSLESKAEECLTKLARTFNFMGGQIFSIQQLFDLHDKRRSGWVGSHDTDLTSQIEVLKYLYPCSVAGVN